MTSQPDNAANREGTGRGHVPILLPGQDHMSPEQRAAYDLDPMVQYDAAWKALGSEDIAEALHRVHDGHRRDHRNDRALDCWTCCCQANAVRQVLEARQLGAKP